MTWQRLFRRLSTGRLPARIRRSEDGASFYEYALLISLIMVVCVISVAYLGTSVLTDLDSTGSVVGPP